MIHRALLFVVAACGTREPAHTEVAAAPSASSSAPTQGEHQVRGEARIGRMTVGGRLPPEVIERVMTPILPRARACNPKPADDDAMAMVHFVIGRQGDIGSVKVENVPDSVASCISALFESLAFPAPEGGIVTVVYPLVFHTP